jgi:uncharacterized protein
MTEATNDPLAGIQIIDCDAHFTEPADLWTSRAPKELQGRVPVQKTIDGITHWYIEGDEPWASTGSNTLKKGHGKVLGSHRIQPFSDMDPAAWAVKERLELMDEIGIFAQVLYPNGVGFASNHIFAIDDLKLRTAVLQMYNDFYVDIQEESNGRLFPQAMVPYWDMDLTVKEMTRMLDKGIRGFTLSDKPEMIGLPDLPDPYFEPMWDLFNESGAVPNFHVGSGNRRDELEAIRSAAGGDYAHLEKESGEAKAESAPGIPVLKTPPVVLPMEWGYFPPQRRLAVQATQIFMSNVRIIINLCFSDLFDRFPKINLVSAESGIGWVPTLLESMDYQYDQMVTKPDELSFAKRRPSEYFHSNIYTMFWFEEVGVKRLLEDVGVDKVLVETDIPHSTCLYPGPREHFAKVLGGFDRSIQEKVLQNNAAKLYGIKVPSSGN